MDAQNFITSGLEHRQRQSGNRKQHQPCHNQRAGTSARGKVRDLAPIRPEPEQGEGEPGESEPPGQRAVEGILRKGGPGGAPFGRLGNAAPSALALKPDALITVMAPYGLEEYRPIPHRWRAPRPSAWKSLTARFKDLLNDSRAAHMAQHFFYLSLPRYVAFYLRHRDAADFLRPPFTPAWRTRLAFADRTIGSVADQAHRAGVPFIVLFMPRLLFPPVRGPESMPLPCRKLWTPSPGGMARSLWM